MKIITYYHQKTPVLSLEIFPPRADYPLETIFATLNELIKLTPRFISVTYGAGGSNRTRTVEIAARIKKEYGVEALAHLTCIRHSRKEVEQILSELLHENIINIMALRGDLPEDDPEYDLETREYQFADELVAHARRIADFGIAAAAHPEGHPECSRLKEDLKNLKHKVEAGVDFLITQMFFDNRVYYEFVDKAMGKNILCPIIPGIMPVLNAGQIKKIIYLCGASIPARLLNLVDKYQHNTADMEKVGIEYASCQIDDLLSSQVPGIHMYTMNKSDQITEIINNTGLA